MSSGVGQISGVGRSIRVSSRGGIAQDMLGVLLGVSLVNVAELALHLIAGKIRLLVPSIIRSWRIKLLKILLRRPHASGGSGSSIASDITEQDGGILDWYLLACLSRKSLELSWKIQLTQFAELAVGDNESAQSAQSLESLVAMLLGLFLIHRGTREADGLRVELLCLPNEILEEVSLILGEQEILGLFHNLPEIGNELLSLWRELLGWVCERLRLEEAVQRNIDLVVLQENSQHGIPQLRLR